MFDFVSAIITSNVMWDFAVFGDMSYIIKLKKKVKKRIFFDHKSEKVWLNIFCLFSISSHSVNSPI